MCLRRYGIGLKSILVWCLVLLACCSHTCWADVVLTDEEATALETSLRTAKKELNEQASRIENLESNLSEAEKQLTEAKKSQAELQTTIDEQRNRLTTLSTSLKKQEREQKMQKFWTGVKIVGAFVLGGAVGYTVGNL